MQKVYLNPAAVAAFASGDFENAAVAATPSSIEAQELAGQATMIANGQLPRRMIGASRPQLQKLGFRFGADIDQLFVHATLPAGWKIVADKDDAMHSDLLDSAGCVRAGVFYKAAFYDRRADIRFNPRYMLTHDYSDSGKVSTSIQDNKIGEVVVTLGSAERRDFKTTVKLEEEAEAWLNEHYPKWKDPLAYWSKP